MHKRIKEHSNALAKLADLSAIEKAAQSVADCFLSGSKLYILGSGPSHIIAKYAEALFMDSSARPPLPAVTLLPDYYLSAQNQHEIFEKQLTALLGSTDSLFALSAGHPCEAVTRALRYAGHIDAATIGFSGKDNGTLHGLCDILVPVEHNDPLTVTEIHVMLLHMLCKQIDKIMFSIS